MKFNRVIPLLFILLLTAGCFQSARSRVCITSADLENYSGMVTVFESNDALLIAYKLSSPPDISSLVAEEDKEFLKLFTVFDPILVTTNIDEMRKENGYTFAQLGDGTNSYAQEHMKVYVKSKNEVWYSIRIPKYC